MTDAIEEPLSMYERNVALLQETNEYDECHANFLFEVKDCGHTKVWKTLRSIVNNSIFNFVREPYVIMEFQRNGEWLVIRQYFEKPKKPEDEIPLFKEFCQLIKDTADTL